MCGRPKNESNVKDSAADCCQMHIKHTYSLKLIITSNSTVVSVCACVFPQFRQTDTVNNVCLVNKMAIPRNSSAEHQNQNQNLIHNQRPFSKWNWIANPLICEMKSLQENDMNFVDVVKSLASFHLISPEYLYLSIERSKKKHHQNR